MPRLARYAATLRFGFSVPPIRGVANSADTACRRKPVAGFLEWTTVNSLSYLIVNPSNVTWTFQRGGSFSHSIAVSMQTLHH